MFTASSVMKFQPAMMNSAQNTMSVPPAHSARVSRKNRSSPMMKMPVFAIGAIIAADTVPKITFFLLIRLYSRPAERGCLKR